MGSPSMPEPIKPPAQRPERNVEVVAEDIVLGGTEDLLDPKNKGKMALTRPRGTAVQQSTSSTGLVV